MATIEELADTFKLLSDPTRLHLVRLLAENGNLCVNALAKRLAVTQSAVSQHLRLLRQAGLVAGTRQGSFIHYSLRADRWNALQKRLHAVLGSSGNEAD